MGLYMEMGDDELDPISIENAVKTEFKETYDVDVEYVNAAYDIEDFFKLCSDHHELLKKKNILESIAS